MCVCLGGGVDDRMLFGLVTLLCAQAGLSWWVTATAPPLACACCDRCLAIPTCTHAFMHTIRIQHTRARGRATILAKREGYRAAFANFDVQQVAAFGEAEVSVCASVHGDTLLAQPRIAVLSVCAAAALNQPG